MVKNLELFHYDVIISETVWLRLFIASGISHFFISFSLFEIDLI